MKTWLVIVSVVAVLLAASTGVGFWMLMDTEAELADTKAELTGTKADLTDAKAELTEIQEKLEENFGYWREERYPWQQGTTKAPWEEGATEGRYPWCEGIEETIWDLELRIEELKRTVEDLEWQLLWQP